MKVLKCFLDGEPFDTVPIFSKTSSSEMANPYNILLIEPSEEQAARFKAAVGQMSGFCIVSHVADSLAAVAYMRGRGESADRQRFPFPDIVILDAKAPNYEHIDFAQWAHRRSVRPVLAVFSPQSDAHGRKIAEQLQADLYEPNIWDPHVFNRFLHFTGNISTIQRQERGSGT